jgi:hypothetical protein
LALVQFGKYEQSSPDRDCPQMFEKIKRLKSRVIINQLPDRKKRTQISILSLRARVKREAGFRSSDENRLYPAQGDPRAIQSTGGLNPVNLQSLNDWHF